jgi:hypothetical protein
MGEWAWLTEHPRWVWGPGTLIEYQGTRFRIDKVDHTRRTVQIGRVYIVGWDDITLADVNDPATWGCLYHFALEIGALDPEIDVVSMLRIGLGVDYAKA